MQIATWNVNSLSVRLPHVLNWLQEHQPEVLCLQETKLSDDKFPREVWAGLGYRVKFFGQKTYNGVALITRSEATDVVHNIPGFADEQARVIAATVEGIRVIGAYFPNGESPKSDKFQYKMKWLKALSTWLVTELKQHSQLALLGDFNIAPEDRDVYDPVAWAGQIHCTTEERSYFQALIALGLFDAFRLFEQASKSWSWWDYRNLAFRKNQGLRIDHILISAALRDRARSCLIDKAPRKLERPSDHAPVVLELSPPLSLISPP
jgi:exodeoxyribonuclease-3